jgi:hypothetical protein
MITPGFVVYIIGFVIVLGMVDAKIPPAELMTAPHAESARKVAIFICSALWPVTALLWIGQYLKIKLLDN